MKKILCTDQLGKIAPGLLEPVVVHQYFSEVVKAFEDRHCIKYTLTPTDAEKLRVLLKKCKASL